MAALICLPDNPCVTDIHNNRSGSWQSVFTQTRQVSASIRPQPRLISPSERGACTPQPCPPPGTCWALVRFPHWLREGDPTHASAHSRSRAPVRVGTQAPFHASVCLLRWSQFLGRPVAGRATVLFSNAAARAPTAGGGGTLSAPRCPRLAPELPKNLLFWGHPISLFLRVL